MGKRIIRVMKAKVGEGLRKKGRFSRMNVTQRSDKRTGLISAY